MIVGAHLGGSNEYHNLCFGAKKKKKKQQQKTKKKKQNKKRIPLYTPFSHFHSIKVGFRIVFNTTDFLS